MKRFAIAFVFACIFSSALSQNQPVPSYVTQQAFPDSVNAVSLIRTDGSKTNLGEVLAGLKGKKLFVDIWASWCRDCIVGMPKLHELHGNTDHKTTSYLMLSVDRDQDKWKAAIEKYNIPGEHYFIETGWKNALSNYIVLDWIPRYLVLDSNGRVTVPKAIEVTDKSIQAAINKNL